MKLSRTAFTLPEIILICSSTNIRTLQVEIAGFYDTGVEIFKTIEINER